ncbi:MAG: DNA polymerase III subunit gamma/tau [Bacillales bacterium]|nr:DNA polymerase III subunit gamma/tau [Bacillales bacterium]
MYQVLYRKYRPKTLQEVAGQDIVVKILKNSLKNDKLSHAYLFSGPRGTGKTSIAKILARVINCSNPVDYSPCNKCVSCTQKNNVDIIEIDAASNNGVDEIRELKNKINLVPSFGKYKIYIIDEVHMLSIGAFNALLKTLEEPPAHAMFILATTEPHKIPVTILSRCQRLDFKKISEESIFKRLNEIVEKEKINIDPEAIKEIARLSDGGMRDAISMLDQASSYSNDKIELTDIYEINGIITKKMMNEFLLDLFNSNLLEILNLLDTYNNNGKNLVKLFEEIMLYMKNILIYKYAPDYFVNKNEKVDDYEAISSLVDEKKLTYAIKEFSNVLSELKYSNNPKLQIELVIIKIMDSLKKDEVINEGDTNTKHPLVEEKVKKEEITEEVKNNNDVTDTKKEDSKENSNEATSEESLVSNTKINESKNNIEEVKEEKKIFSKVKTKEEIFEKFKELRINNTLSKFNKKLTTLLKENIISSKEKIYEFKNRELLSLVFDAEVKAASDENVIFLFDDNKLSDYFNENIFEIEDILKQLLNKNYKIISVDKDLWNNIKKEFNSKAKEYIYESDDSIIKQLKENNVSEQDDITDIFGEIVVYN